MWTASAGCWHSAVAEYPLHRKREDPEYATQSHEDHMRALAAATREAVKKAGIAGDQVEAIALDTTARRSFPWAKICNRSANTTCGAIIAPKAKRRRSPRPRIAKGWKPSTGAAACIRRSGDSRSCCTGFATIPTKRSEFVSAFEHCDMVAATLCGITDPKKVKRSICAMGHKWLWNRALGGLPPEEFLVKVDPLLAGVREKLDGEYATSDQIAGTLSKHWAEKLGLKAGHSDSGRRIRRALGRDRRRLRHRRHGECGRNLHLHHRDHAIGESCSGRLRRGAGKRASRAAPELKPDSRPLVISSTQLRPAPAPMCRRLSQGLENYRAGQTGLLRMTWDNGDRTVLVNPNLRGVTLGWNLQSTAQDELFAAIEGTAFHTRVILDRMAAHGVHIKRVINAGGIPQKNDVLNRVYANVLGRPVLVPSKSVTSLGSAIFAFLAAGTFKTIEEAQKKICPPNRVFEPDKSEQRVYEELYPLYSKLYFAFGDPKRRVFGEVLPALIRVAESVHKSAPVAAAD